MQPSQEARSADEALWTMSGIDTDATITGKHSVQMKHSVENIWGRF